MTSKNIILTIAFAVTLFSSIVPLGFSEPLRVQLEQGIKTDQIQCNNPNHVLVLRTNGNIACVTEKSSLKTGWEIIEINISKSALITDTKTETKQSSLIELSNKE